MDIKSLFGHLRTSPGLFFVIISGFFGLLFIGLTPPLQTPDEDTHFLRAYQVSQFGLIATNHDGTIGGNLPVSIQKTQNLLETQPTLRFNPGAKYDLHKTKEALKIGLDKNKTSFQSVGGAVGYSPIGYIPQAIGIAIGVLLSLPPILLMYVARVANLIVWIVLIYNATRLFPYKKWALAGLALFPMFVAQAGSPGIDMLSIGLATLFISYILHLRARPLISGRSILFIFLLGCAIALTKQTTILVLGFVFLLKLSQFDGIRIRAVVKMGVLVVVPIVLSIVWVLLMRHFNLSAAPGIPGQNSSQQIAGMIGHPLRLPMVIFNTFFFTLGDGVVGSFMGSFGWLDTPLSSGFVMIGYVCLAFLLFTNYEKPVLQLRKFDKWLIATIITVYALGTMVALYIIYAPVNFGVLYGLQGRYFLLMALMAIPLFWSTPIKIARRHYVMFLKVTTIGLLVSSALTIYLRFYGNYTF